MAIQDTGSLPIVMARCKYLSASFHEQIDADYGQAIKENGGYVTYTIRCEGQPEPRWWEKALRFLKPGSGVRLKIQPNPPDY